MLILGQILVVKFFSFKFFLKTKPYLFYLIVTAEKLGGGFCGQDLSGKNAFIFFWFITKSYLISILVPAENSKACGKVPESISIFTHYFY